MQYRLCETNTAKKLEEEVNQLMQNGWRPLGGVAVEEGLAPFFLSVAAGGKWWYYQALIKDDPQSAQPQEGIQSVK